MSLLLPAKFISLDSSLLAGLAKDHCTPKKTAQARARAFMQELISERCVLLICWHHFEELIRHRDVSVAADRVAFLKSIPFLGWIRSRGTDQLLGSIVDMFVSEVSAALEEPNAAATEVARMAKLSLVSFGSGERVLEQYLRFGKYLGPSYGNTRIGLVRSHQYHKQ